MHHHNPQQNLSNKEKVLTTGNKTELQHVGKGSCVLLSAKTLPQAMKVVSVCYFSSFKKRRRATFYPIGWVPASVNKQ